MVIKLHNALSAIIKTFLILHTTATFTLAHTKKDHDYCNWEDVRTALVNSIHNHSAPATCRVCITLERHTIPGYARDMLLLDPYDN